MIENLFFFIIIIYTSINEMILCKHSFFHAFIIVKKIFGKDKYTK